MRSVRQLCRDDLTNPHIPLGLPLGACPFPGCLRSCLAGLFPPFRENTVRQSGVRAEGAVIAECGDVSCFLVSLGEGVWRFSGVFLSVPTTSLQLSPAAQSRLLRLRENPGHAWGVPSGCQL